MDKKFIRVSFLICLDIFQLSVVVILAYLLRFDFSYDKVPANFLENIGILILINAFLKIICFALFKIYSSLWRYAGIHELSNILAAAIVGNSIMQSVLYIFKIPAPRSIFIIAFLLDLFFIGGSRFFYRLFRRIVRGELIRIKDSKRVLIVGAGRAGALVLNELKNNPGWKSSPICILDDDHHKQGRKINGVPILGRIEDIAKIVQKKKIDEVIIAIPSAGKKIVNQIYNEVSKTSCKVKILPSYGQILDESVVIAKLKDVDIEDLLGREAISLDSEGISSYIKDRVVLITGGGGSIGSELCRQIAIFKPAKLIILDNYENNAFDIEIELRRKKKELQLNVIIANVREIERLEEVFSEFKPDVVFHAAAHKHVPLMEEYPIEAVKNNVFGTFNVANCASKYGAKRFVLISTDKAVNPTSVMGATKRLAEMLIQAVNRDSDTEFVAVRFGNVLGSNGSVIPVFKKQIEEGGPVTVTHPDVKRYFMTIPEAVQLVIQAGAMAKGGEIFVLDMGQLVRIYDLARNLIKLSGFIPDEEIKIEYIGLRTGEKLYEELLLDNGELVKTSNDKIFVEKPEIFQLEALKKSLDELLEVLKRNKNDEIKEMIRKLVPTYNIATKQ